MSTYRTYLYSSTTSSLGLAILTLASERLALRLSISAFTIISDISWTGTSFWAAARVFLQSGHAVAIRSVVLLASCKTVDAAIVDF